MQLEEIESKGFDACARIEELEAALAAESRGRAELIHLVSHELRTPITIISGFARLLKNPPAGDRSGERSEDFIEEILKACRRLDAFVGELIEVGPDAGDVLSVVMAPARLSVVLAGVLESLAPMLSERQLAVSVQTDDAIGAFEFDAGRIEQVLTNLMTNAIRYGREGGVVKIVAERVERDSGPFAVISVEDDGPGIAEADRERLFQPYIRGSVPNGCEGLGIGLAICHRILASHSGSIHVEEGALGGARFVVALPMDARASEKG